MRVCFHDNTVIVSGVEMAKINVYDVSGQYIYSRVASELSLDGIAKGIYIVNVETNGGDIKTVKVYVK